MTEATAHDFELNTIDGEPQPLSSLKGKVLLLVNVASECGFTPQYAGLEALHRKYGPDGLVVMGIPANQFGGQEPGSNGEIKSFCTTRYDVTFPMYEKIVVKGEGQHPLYAFLTSQKGQVTWNFNKFLVDKDGRVLARFESKVEPESPELIEAVQSAL